MAQTLLSVLIPSLNCPYVIPTIQDVLTKAIGDIEVIVNIGDKWPQPLITDKRVTYIHPGVEKGMRYAINATASLAKGRYLMKTDDHCLFAPGFDKALIDHHLEETWVSVPRRYSLDAENWKINETRPYRDYHYLSFPDPNKSKDEGLKGMEWAQLTKARSDPKYEIDDLMSFQGSCWFMTKSHFDNFIGGLDETHYGRFAQEPQEIGLTTWLGGGRVIINKTTWYAHLHKTKEYIAKYGRVPLDRQDLHKGHVFTVDYWMGNKWPKRIHDIDWLIAKFWPVPTWPQNWQELFKT